MSRRLLGVPRIRTQVAGADVEGTTAGDTGGEPRSKRGEPTPEADAGSWADKVKDAIPVEVVAAWAAIEALIGQGGGVFADSYAYPALVGAMAVVTAVHMWVDVETPTRERASNLGVPFAYLKHSQYAQILLAVGAFLVWAYFLGGLYPRDVPGVRLYYPIVAKVLLPLYVVVGPQLLPAVLQKFHDVDVPDDGEPLPVETLKGGGGE